MYKPFNFLIQELVPPRIYHEYAARGRLDLLWYIFDKPALTALQLLRDQYGPIKVNDWYWGGVLKESGFRYFETKTGAKLSQHKFGRGIDSHPEDISVEQIRADILSGKAKASPLITCLEMDIPWLHFDTRNWDVKKYGILKIYPAS